MAAGAIGSGLASPVHGQESTDVARIRAELDRRYAQNSVAFMRGDLRALMASRSPEFHTFPANGVRHDRAATWRVDQLRDQRRLVDGKPG